MTSSSDHPFDRESKPSYIAIAGPTASGKSALALKLAQEFSGELINCDSVQLYKGFDIGSAKADPEEQALCRHHLIDRLEWFEDYDARRFAFESQAMIDAISQREALPIVVGGTGLYLRALWQEGFDDLPKSELLRQQYRDLSTEQILDKLNRLDPVRASQLHPNDRFRIVRSLEVVELTKQPFPQQESSALDPPTPMRQRCFAIKLSLPREALHERIVLRTHKMLESGLVDEVRSLLERGVKSDCKVMQSIGYREVFAMLSGELSESKLAEAIIVATRQYAKRQETWFRKVRFDRYIEASDSSLAYGELSSMVSDLFPADRTEIKS